METSLPTCSKPTEKTINEWFNVAPVADFPNEGGVAVLCKGQQLAVFHFAEKGEWYASQNLCPHKMEMALSRGIIGDAEGEPKVSCPFHKKNFSLSTGQCLNDDSYHIEIYPVKVENGFVYVGIPDGF